VIGPRGEIHRFGESPVMLQGVTVLLAQLTHGVSSEKLTVDAIAGRFPRRGFGPVLTELRETPVTGLGVWPRTTGAIESVRLVQRAERLCTTRHSHFTHR